MPAIIDYETLGRTLAEEVSRQVSGQKRLRSHKGESRSAPMENRLLLETKVAVEADLLSDTEAKGTLYVLAQPKLNAKTQTITLKDVALETDSQNVLFSMVGKAAEPLLLDAVSRRIPLDLGPKLKDLGDRAENTLSALSSENVSVTGKVQPGAPYSP